jgi:hypothetical protein
VRYSRTGSGLARESARRRVGAIMGYSDVLMILKARITVNPPATFS